MTPKQTEIPLKQWVMEQSIRCGVKPGTIYDRLQDGKYGTVPIRRINQRVIFIEAAFRPPRLTIEALPGEKRLSQWVKQEASRTGQKSQTIYMRFRSHRYSLKLRKVNRGVIFVQEAKA